MLHTEREGQPILQEILLWFDGALVKLLVYVSENQPAIIRTNTPLSLTPNLSRARTTSNQKTEAHLVLATSC